MNSSQLRNVDDTSLVGEVGIEVLPGAGACPLCGSAALSALLSAPDRYQWRKEIYDLVRCNSCSLVWLASPPRPHEMAVHYGVDYYKGIATAGEAIDRWRKQRAVIGRYKQSGDVLDIGCGSGGFLRTFKGHPWKLHGIEIAAAMADRARLNAGASVFVGDALSAPFAPESFDVITCFDVLEHVYDPQGLLRKVLEWLKPGGVFYTMLPNIDSWEARMFGSYWYGLELPRHLFHFSPRSLRNAMESVGFGEGYIKTQRGSYFQLSTRYLCDGLLDKCGVSVRPLVRAKQPGIPWRIVRKALRLSVIATFGLMAAVSGSGACMEAIFVKPTTNPRRIGAARGGGQ
jgi:SAM-dependent methyltransferase